MDSTEALRVSCEIESLPKIAVCRHNNQVSSDSKNETKRNEKGQFSRREGSNDKSPETYRGLGRLCFNCESNHLFHDATSLKRHLRSSCPSGKVDGKSQRFAELLAAAKIEAKGRSKRSKKNIQQPTMDKTPSPLNKIKIVNIVDRGNVVEKGIRSTKTVERDQDFGNPLLLDVIDSFEKSQSNPLSGSSNKADSTLKKHVDNSRRTIVRSKLITLSDLISECGWQRLNDTFKCDWAVSTKKDLIGSLISFVEFLQLHHDEALSFEIEQQLRRLSLRLERAYVDFCQGTRREDKNRRLAFSEMLKEGKIATFSQVAEISTEFELKVIFEIKMVYNKFVA